MRTAGDLQGSYYRGCARDPEDIRFGFITQQCWDRIGVFCVGFLLNSMIGLAYSTVK